LPIDVPPQKTLPYEVQPADGGTFAMALVGTSRPASPHAAFRPRPRRSPILSRRADVSE